MSELFLRNETLYLRCEYNEKELAKLVRGCRWDKSLKCWQLPLRLQVIEQAERLFPNAALSEEVNEQKSILKQQEMSVKAIKTFAQVIEPLEPLPVKAKPFQHQIAAYNLGITLPNAALLMEQGTGKTLTALAIIGRRYLDGQIKRLLVVAPAAVVPVWQKEFAAFADYPADVLLLVGAVKDRKKLLAQKRQKSGLEVAVINYEATWRMEKELAKWAADMIVCDESQRIKTPSSAQSKCLHRLGSKAKYKLILTGTPVTQGPLDFFSQYKFLDPNIFGTSFTAFRSRYALMGGFQGHQVVGYQNLPELINLAHSCAYRVTKEEALDLPEQLDQILYCQLEPAARRSYNELLKENITVLSEEKVITAQNVLSRLLRLSQLTGGFVGTGEEAAEVSSAKLNLLEETLKEIMAGGKKVVVFARFTAEIQAIKKMLERLNLNYAYIAGEVAQKLRGGEVERFQHDEDCKVFLAQTRTAGLGLTLTAADTAIFYSLDYSFADYDQARCRIHRIGQKNRCTYIHLLVQNTVDEKVLEVLKNKRSVADDVVDKWREYM